jgi:hypothetical protein
MRIVDPPFALQREGFLDGEDCAPHVDAEEEVERLVVARKQRDRGPPQISRVAAAYRARDALATVRVRRQRSACWPAGRWREKILPAPRRASLQASVVTCSAATFAALSSRRLRGRGTA